jgi:plastocyanin
MDAGVLAPAKSMATRRSRRRVAQVLMATAGGVLLIGGAVNQTRLPVAAQDGGNDNDSGRGRGRGRGGDDDSSGHGGDDELVQPAAAPPGSIEVRIVSDDAGGFVPSDLTVDLGQTVAFVNAHHDEHTATGSGFDTGIIPSGGVATVVLDEAGTFAYACQIHPVMTGVIRVRGADGTVPEAQPAATPVGAAAVSIANLAFDPPSLDVAAGDTIVWRNDDTVPHTVTADDGSFDSGIFDPGATFSQVFENPGTFAYHCNVHPQMKGRIAVGTATALAESTPPSVTAVSADAPQTTSASQAQSPPAPVTAAVGVWLGLLTPREPAAMLPQRLLLTLRADGTATASFAADVGQPVLEQVVSLAQGSWTAPTDAEAAVDLIALVLDPEQRFAGTLTIQLRGRLEEADTLTGPVDLALTASDGSPLPTIGATFSGRRFGSSPATGSVR